MALLMRPSGTRRDFLQALGAGVMVAGAATAGTRWALLSDTHIPTDPENGYRGFKPFDNLSRIVPDIIRFAPDGVVIERRPGARGGPRFRLPGVEDSARASRRPRSGGSRIGQS